MSQDIRVRFAPSPTGTLHLGSARTALFNWLFARHQGGRFILRIEDTDRERSAQEFEQAILEDLKWLGLDWDEGPFADGDYGPYHQSLRTELYAEQAQRLKETGHTYRCYCSEDELEAERQSMLNAGVMPKYSGKCRLLSETECEQKEASGLKPTLRFIVPKREIIINDLIRGRVVFSSDVIGDFIIIRSDGIANFNFAVVVDDMLMRISHIIRGEDHLTNTARHVLLFEALGAKVPEFAHISMLFGTDGSKLSKRHGATAVSEFREMGYIPEALINYLALLGWSAESAEDVLSVSELVKLYRIDRMSKSPSIFDIGKLTWLNGQHIRRAPAGDLAEKLEPILRNGGLIRDDAPMPDLNQVTEAVSTSLERLNDVLEEARVFYEANAEPDQAAAALLNESRISEIAPAADEILSVLSEFTAGAGKQFMRDLAEKMKPAGISGKELFLPLRAALTGQLTGPDLHYVLEIFGPAKSRARLAPYLSSEGS